jgi:site-specific DNA-methyltransferase (adenine-specific)
MKPYYEDDSVTIYHGDCRAILPCLPATHLLLTDPPYGRQNEESFNDDFLDLIGWNIAVVILDWRNPLRGRNKIGELVWEYGWVSGFRSNARSGICHTHNTIHILGNPQQVNFTDGSIIPRQPGFSSPRHCSFATKSGHPYEKPVKLIQWLLSRISLGSVCDPFIGSGTTLLAARQLGRKSIGIEIDERYCEIAAKRMTEQLQQVLQVLH